GAERKPEGDLMLTLSGGCEVTGASDSRSRRIGFPLPAHREDDATPRLPAQHALVGLGYALQRENFIHRAYAGKHAESEHVLRIDRGTRLPALHRQASSDEMTGRNREGRRPLLIV